MRVKCTVDESFEQVGDGGPVYDRMGGRGFSAADDRYVDKVTVHCSRCGHSTESYGKSEGSIKRCLALLREECPKGERNFYVAPGG